MRASCHNRLLAWALLIIASTLGVIGSPATTGSDVFEVDALFPRNATYTPEILMPVVWAIQNPDLATPLSALITWDLWEGNNRSSLGSVNGGVFELYGNDYGTNGTFYEYRIIDTASYPEGFWTLYWDLEIYNVSGVANTTGTYIHVNGTTLFTVNKSGQTPDLVAATSSDACGSADSVAFDVIPVGTEAYVKSTATANPCSATINSSVASSILASATAIACQPGHQNPNVSCSASSGTSSASSVNLDSRILTVMASISLTVLGAAIFL